MRRGPWNQGRYVGHRSDGTAYLLAMAGFVGFAGLHRFYLGRPLTGLIWLFTLGFCGLGTIMDLLFMGSLVRDAREQH